MFFNKWAVLAGFTFGAAMLPATSMAVASFSGTANAQLTLTAGAPLVGYLTPSSLLYVNANYVPPGTVSASASSNAVSASVSGVPTLVADAANAGAADSGGTGYADATAQSTIFTSFSLINNTKSTINYTLHLDADVAAGGSADTANDYYYIDSGYTLNKNSVPYSSANWVWNYFGPESQSLDTGPISFDISQSLFAGQTVSWSLTSTVNGYAQSVPEPATTALLGFGVSALFARRRRINNKS